MPSRDGRKEYYHGYQILHEMRQTVPRCRQGGNLPTVQGAGGGGEQESRRPQGKDGELVGRECSRPC